MFCIYIIWKTAKQLNCGDDLLIQSKIPDLEQKVNIFKNMVRTIEPVTYIKEQDLITEFINAVIRVKNLTRCKECGYIHTGNDCKLCTEIQSNIISDCEWC